MPIYEYRCPFCGVIELIQKISDPPFETCPTCHTNIHKLISPSSFRLKGSCWASDGYKSRLHKK